MSAPKAEETFGLARLLVRRGAPYFRSALIALVPVAVEGLGTIGVSDRAVLFYDPAWIAAQQAPAVAGLLVHEILHVLNRHGKSRRGDRDPALWNCSCDLAINDTVVEMGFALPSGKDYGLFPKDFGFASGLTAEAYYVLLQKGGNAQAKQAAEAKSGHGKCGSGAGNPHDHEPKEDGDKGGGEKGDDYAGRTDAQLARVAKQVAAAVEEHAQRKGRGSLPAGLERWAAEINKPPKVPWTTLLRRALRAGVATRPGAVVHRHDGVSRRQSGVGFGDGKPVLPRLRQPVPRVAVVVDTSGSMSAEQLGLALRETRGLLRQVGASVTMLACDAEVHAAREISSVADAAKLLVGGGGSSFIPAFDHLEKSRDRPGVVALITDGDISVPHTPPPWARVIWVCVGRNAHPPAAWGVSVKIDD